jgi:hypothetical protein
MNTRSQTTHLTNRNKRISRQVVRLIDEYNKYTSGKYHGWNDTYDRQYHIDDMYHVNIDSDEEEDYYKNFHIKRKEFRFQNAPLKRKKFTKEGYDTSDDFVVCDENDVNWSDYENEL